MTRALALTLALTAALWADGARVKLEYAANELIGQSAIYVERLDQRAEIAVEGDRKTFVLTSASRSRVDFTSSGRGRLELVLRTLAVRFVSQEVGGDSAVFDSAAIESSDETLRGFFEPLLKGEASLQIQRDGSRPRIKGKELDIERRRLSIFESAWPKLPSDSVSVGERWSKVEESDLQRGLGLEIRWEYTLAALERSPEGRTLARIEAVLAMGTRDELLVLDRGEGTCVFRFDVERGLLVAAEGRSRVEVFAPGSESAITDTFELELVDLAPTAAR